MQNQYIPSQSIPQISQQYSYAQMGLANQAMSMPSQIDKFWKDVTYEMNDGKAATMKNDLPMARIKKIMKMDDSVQACMISAEAPMVIAKACELFIRELTLRAWEHTDENKRRTLQKVDITSAVGKNEMYDFLIDIIPREESSTDIATDSNRIMGMNQMVFFYPPGNPPMVESSIQQVTTGQIPSYLTPNQATYPQPISQPISQGLPVVSQQPASYTTAVPPSGNNFMFMNDLPSVQSVPAVSATPSLQNNGMMNPSLMGMVGFGGNYDA